MENFNLADVIWLKKKRKKENVQNVNRKKVNDRLNT